MISDWFHELLSGIFAMRMKSGNATSKAAEMARAHGFVHWNTLLVVDEFIRLGPPARNGREPYIRVEFMATPGVDSDLRATCQTVPTR